MSIDYQPVLSAAANYQADISKFLRDIIAIPSNSGQEQAVIDRIGSEMERAGFDRVETDPMGNLHGTVGHGSRLLAMDAHVDTVGVGNPDLWEVDPYQGFEDEEVIVGRGASDQKGGMASLVYAGRLIRELGLEDDFTLLVTGTVQEEDCDGLCWQYIVNERGIRPEFVVLTEPTSCRIHRGQRGRVEFRITTKGLSAHGSAPERGDNAIYKMAPILQDLQALHLRLADHEFLGKGSLTVSEIFYSSPSRCAVADGCSISVDRRLTYGETPESAQQEIAELPAVREAEAKVEFYDYQEPAYTGLVYPAPARFPTWLIDEGHEIVRLLSQAYQGLFKEQPVVDKWTFSTNGVAIMGMYDIPCIGFGPGHEDQAHAPNEKTWKAELVKAAAMYAVIPKLFCVGM
jgi:putative selenium metabolism hydrolase